MPHINNVLLIDDQESFNFMHEKTIEKAEFSHDIKTFESGATALAYLWRLSLSNPEKFPDMIFLDLNMPVMSGWDFLDSIKNLSDSVLKNCKIFILTSSIDNRDIEQSKEYKMVTDFISKPLTEKRLQDISVEPHSTTNWK